MEFKEKALVEKIKQEEEQEQQQEKLREKHVIEDENVVVVEKFSMTKFLVRTFVIFVKTTVSIAILVLASLGLIAVIYEEPRTQLFEIIQSGFDML